MAIPTPRVWSPARVPKRVLIFGLAAVIASSGTYLALLGNPLTRNQQAVAYQTSPVTQGSVQVTVAATGPITNPASVPFSFASSGKLSEIDVSVGQTVAAGQVLAKIDTTALQIQVDQAQATLAQQQGAAAKVAAAATPEQAAVTQAQIDAAQTTLDAGAKSLQASQATSATTIVTA